MFLTHLHIDHVGELPGLFKARAVSSIGPIRFQVLGPDGRKGSGDDASVPSTTRFVDLVFGSEGAFGNLREFSVPMTIQPTETPKRSIRPHRTANHRRSRSRFFAVWLPAGMKGPASDANATEYLIFAMQGRGNIAPPNLRWTV